jgi:hypothetical protein
MTYLFRPIHPTLHRNADGSKFECLQTEGNSFWFLHSFKVEYPVYVLIEMTPEDMEDYGAFEDWWCELNSQYRKSYVDREYYSHHISAYDINCFLSACRKGLSPDYQLNSWQQEVYKLYLAAKSEQEAQDKDVAEMLNYISFDFSDSEVIQVY